MKEGWKIIKIENAKKSEIRPNLSLFFHILPSFLPSLRFLPPFLPSPHFPISFLSSPSFILLSFHASFFSPFHFRPSFLSFSFLHSFFPLHLHSSCVLWWHTAWTVGLVLNMSYTFGTPIPLNNVSKLKLAWNISFHWGHIEAPFFFRWGTCFEICNSKPFSHPACLKKSN